MRQFRLIKEYYRSPAIGTIVMTFSGDGLEPHYNYNGGNLTTGIAAYIVENNPDIWEEIIEQEYEILSFRMLSSFEMTGRIFSDCSDSKYKLEWYLGEVKAKRAEIYSIKRLSDGEIFTLGDRINFYGHIADITAFKPERYNTVVETYRVTNQANLKGYSYWSIDILTKAKEVLFTTEDGVEIYEGDLVTWLYSDSLSICDTRAANKNMDFTYMYFSTKEKAQEYIALHKKKYSLDNIIKGLRKSIPYDSNIRQNILNSIINETA